MSDRLQINEIFFSIQGESTRVGLPCIFVRLTGCHLRCHYCDTEYAFYEGKAKSIDAVLAKVGEFNCDLVEVTGGEPLLQPNVHLLMTRLCDMGKTVLLETSGASDISVCDQRVIRIVDLKTPGSGEGHRNLWSNLEHLAEQDEVKLVICDRNDYDWASSIIRKHRLIERVAAVLLSPVASVDPGAHIAGSPGLAIEELAQWVLKDRLAVRIQTQLHKLIWDPMTRGV